MVKLAILKLYGDLHRRGFEVVLELGDETQRPDLELHGYLPPDPSLLQQIEQHWHSNYRAIGSPYSHRAFRLKPKHIAYKDDTVGLLEACQESSQALERQFQTWLRSQSFRDLDIRLREELSRDEDVRVVVRCDLPEILKLPWHRWDFVRRYPNAEVAFGFPFAVKPTRCPLARPQAPVRVLAILGHAEGIDIDRDREFLNHLPNTEVTFLVQPRRQEIGDCLWEQNWDAIFFAGHSETEGDTGRIYINDTESLSLEDLWYGLQKALDGGLKLAIFNSCDGLGLARGLDRCQIPFTIVMREVVPDKVAQEFLKHFLQSFARGTPFHLAVREARERLQGLEDRYPCASWLPIVLQHPSVIPPSWDEWTRPKPIRPSPRQPWTAIVVLSVAIAMMVVGLRWLGVLQPWELMAYDSFLRSRPIETLEDRILVVGVNEGDIERYGYPIPDGVFADAVETLNQANPIAIGLNVYRDRSQPPGSDRLALAFGNNEKLVSSCNFRGVSPRDWIAPPPDSPVAQQSYDNVPVDRWGYYFLVRRYFLDRTENDLHSNSPCETSVSLGWQLARRYFQARNIPVTSRGDLWEIGDRVVPRLRQHSGGYQRLEEAGNTNFYQLPIFYRPTRNPLQVSPTVSLRDLLDGRVKPEQIRDRLVLMGMTAESVDNWAATPYGLMRGTVVQAHFISQLIAAGRGERPLIWWLPPGLSALWIGAWAVLGTMLVAFWRRSPLKLALGTLTAVFALYGLCKLAFLDGLWLPWIPSLLALLGAAMLALAGLTSVQRLLKR